MQLLITVLMPFILVLPVSEHVRAVGNSLEDIAELVRYAHVYNVRIYVTVNTILKEEELKETERMIWELYRIGVDALIVQDMGITRLNLPPIPLHGSTQMDNRTPEKVRFLAVIM